MDDFGTASIWVIEDVSEQRRAEQVIQQAQERLELAQEAGKIGVFDLNLVTGEIVWSDKLAQMMGLPPGTQPDGRDFWLNCLHPEDRDQAGAYFDSCLAGTEDYLRDSWRIVRPDGEVRWFLEAARIFRNAQGQPVRVVGVNVDIHDQKLLEEQVAGQLDFQQALIDAIPVPLFYKGADGRYIGVNRAYEQAFGVTREALIGKTVMDLDYLPQETRTRFEQDAVQAMEGERKVHREVDLPYADGELHQGHDAKQRQDLQRLLQQREPQHAPRQRRSEIREQHVGQGVLTHQAGIGDIHDDADKKGPAHADLAELAHGPEAEDQRHPVWNARPPGRRQHVEQQRDDQRQRDEPRPDRQQDAGRGEGCLHLVLSFCRPGAFSWPSVPCLPERLRRPRPAPDVVPAVSARQAP